MSEVSYQIFFSERLSILCHSIFLLQAKNSMNNFLKVNKTFITYFLIIILVIPFFGISFFMSLLGNVLLLLFLIPLLLLILVLIGFNSYKSKINTCSDCGAISFDFNETCVNCGANLEDFSNRNQLEKKPSESTIEVKAEEIK